jgi:uncharacterized DUF497 family protein
MTFHWDEANLRHIARHQISPHEAEHVILNDPLELEVQIVDGEERVPQVGETASGRILVVIATWRDNLIRVVTAWDAAAASKQEYLEYRMTTWPRPS